MKLNWILLSFCFLVSCSNFHEDNIAHVSTFDLTLDNINSSLPLINIVVEPMAFDSMTEYFDKEIELQCQFYMYRNQELVLNAIPSEVEIRGGRTASFDLKSLGIKFDDSVDNSDRKVINPQSTLPFHNLDKIKAIRLRNSGNDQNATLLKDAIYTQLAIDAELNLDLMYYEPSHVFVNDKYYGLLNMRTESNAHGVSRLYDVKKENTTLAKMVPPGIIEFKNGNSDRVDDLVEMVENENVQGLLNEIDLENYIDYIAYESILGHTDWPQNNVRFYAIEDGKFRFILFDLDLACSFELDREPIDFIVNAADSFIKDLFLLLYSDDNFKFQYDTRFVEIVNNDAFNVEKLEAIVEGTVDKLSGDIDYYIQQSYSPDSRIEWLRNVEELNAFYSRRINYVRGSL